MLSYYLDQELDIFELKKCSNVMQAEKPHFHHELSFVLIERGYTSVKFENKNYIFSQRDLIIIPPGLIHNCIPHNIKNWGFITIYIDFKWLNNIFNINIDKDKLFIYNLSNVEYLGIKDYIFFLEENINCTKKEICLMKIIEKYLIQGSKRFKNIELSLLEKEKVKKVKDYIEDNFNKKITLEKLADFSGVSKYYLMRIFKKTYKVSPLTYQRSLRFNFAKKALKKGKDISKIAVNLGYYDQSHFTNEFKKFAGTTPDNYRKGYK